MSTDASGATATAAKEPGMRTAISSTIAAMCIVVAGWAPTAAAESQAHGNPDDPSTECRPIAQLPIGLARSQTMRLNVTCIATPQHPAGSCRVTLAFVDDEGVPVARASSTAPLELTTRVPVRGVASLDLPGHSFVTGPAIRRVVRPVVVFDVKDLLSDRLAMNVEVFDTTTGHADIRYAFEPCRTLPFAFVPSSQRPDGLDGTIRELSFAPPGITVDETVSLNVICNPDAAHPPEPCTVVLRYSPFEAAASGHAAAPAIAELELSIQPGAIGSFELPGGMLGAVPGHRAMFRPSVVGSPAALGRLVTSFEILESATGIAHSLYQPPNKRSPIILR
jgi:hypothetical protein